MLENDILLITIEFKPTVPHCSLATLIGRNFYRIVNNVQLSDRFEKTTFGL